MTTKKLTVGEKNAIVEDIMKASPLPKAVSDAQEALWAFAEKVFNDIFSPQELQLLNSIPKEWLITDNDLRVQFGSSSSRYAYIYFKESRPVPYYLVHKCAKVYADDHPLSLEYDALAEAHKKAEEALADAKRKTRTVVNSCTTANKLKETWPEIAQYVDANLLRPTSNVPAPILNELNTTLKLKAA